MPASVSKFFQKIVHGGSAFFFFFLPTQSPDWESPEFTNFCQACFAVRRFKPTLTIGQMRTALTVAASTRPMGFREVAEVAEIEYGQATHQIAQLADGKGSDPGLNLLVRQREEGRRSSFVVSSRTGKAIACRYVLSAERDRAVTLDADERAELLAEHLKQSILPALHEITTRSQRLSLGSFCVLLYVTLKQFEIGFEGQPLREISSSIGISNVPRHISFLSDGTPKRKGLGLIDLAQNPEDRRLTLPKPSEAGIELMAAISSRLLHRPAAELRRPKPEAIEALESPDDVVKLKKGDYDYFDPDALERSHDQKSK